MSKAIFALWADIKVSDLNRILREHNVRLVMKKSREWGDQVAITAQAITEPAKEQPVLGPSIPEQRKMGIV